MHFDSWQDVLAWEAACHDDITGFRAERNPDGSWIVEVDEK